MQLARTLSSVLVPLFEYRLGFVSFVSGLLADVSMVIPVQFINFREIGDLGDVRLRFDQNFFHTVDIHMLVCSILLALASSSVCGE